MAMQAQLWTMSGLAVELGWDRRTVAMRCSKVPPAGEINGAKAWKIADVIRYAMNDARQRKAELEVQKLEWDLAERQKELVRASEVMPYVVRRLT
jgi:hypothetical protein